MPDLIIGEINNDIVLVRVFFKKKEKKRNTNKLLQLLTVVYTVQRRYE
jgi:hypothetical protein